jgi:hypothetical protein
VTPAPNQSTPDDRVLVSGEMTCVLVEADVVGTPASAPSPTPEPTPVPPGRVSIENDQLDCTYQMSDPRVSGTERFDALTSVVELPDLPGLARMWDNVPVTLTAEGGTWKGCTAGSEFVRMTAARMWTTGSTRYEGQGAFDGLAYTLTFAREARRGDEPYLVSGWIELASPTETGGCIVP